MTERALFAADDGRPLVFVTVGMDHHRFDRLMQWMQDWLHRGPELPVRCLVQHGSSKPPPLAENVDFLGYAQLQEALLRAAAVVCHGGGGTPMMCLWAGRKPVLVPRLSELREAVDDHQVVFCRKLATEGRAFAPEDRASLFRILDDIVAGRESVRFEPDRAHVARSVERFERLVAPLLPSDPAVASSVDRP